MHMEVSAELTLAGYPPAMLIKWIKDDIAEKIRKSRAPACFQLFTSCKTSSRRTAGSTWVINQIFEQQPQSVLPLSSLVSQATSVLTKPFSLSGQSLLSWRPWYMCYSEPAQGLHGSHRRRQRFHAIQLQHTVYDRYVPHACFSRRLMLVRGSTASPTPHHESNITWTDKMPELYWHGMSSGGCLYS
ncbi:hypothetical protein C8R43DRAFT_550736 [Mycena crocata]|nr:hypothetical protein C8R43DRAFT_550736 [Mycena crocata]